MTLTATSFGRDLDLVLLHENEWKLPIKHFSASSLKMAMRCPRQWQERYINKRKERPGAATTLGTAEWNAHVTNYEQKRTSGIDLSFPDMEQAYAESWDKAVEKNGGIGEIAWDASTKWTDVQAMGRTMAMRYHEIVSPRVQPVATELPVRFDVQDVPVPLIGFIDLVKPETTVEHKTSAKSMRQPKPEWTFQNRVYQLVTQRGAEVHIVTKQREPQIITPLEQPDMFLPHLPAQDEATEKLIRNIAWSLNHYYVTLGADEPWPTHGVVSDWACGWCAYRANCPAWRT